MEKMSFKINIGKFLYGAVFMILLPLLLVAWARATEGLIHLPVPSNDAVNIFFVCTGAVLMITAMINLSHFGKGLPMNAYPPQRFVTEGAYAITRDPIYLGAVVLCFSLSALFHSSSGFWLVSPMFTLMVIAYTVGFENERTYKLFGSQNHRSFLSLPPAVDDRPTSKERLGTFALTYPI
jgi:protein-S-isoprenylcysteine O-methyltransferase Ste14